MASAADARSLQAQIAALSLGYEGAFLVKVRRSFPVEEASDALALERSDLMRGTYHVLGGALSPLDGIGPADLRIDELVERVRRDGVREVILAHNASAEGEATAEYIHQRLDGLTTVTRLARGLPAGSDLDLADRTTLAHALQGRTTFK